MAKHPHPNPSIQVTTSIGGTVVVTSDAVLATMDRLSTVASHLHACATDLRRAMDRSDLEPSVVNAAPYAAGEAHGMLEDALRVLTDAHRHAEGVRSGMERALQSYARTEHGVQTVLHTAAESVAWDLGFEARFLAIPFAIMFWPLIVGGIETGLAPRAGSALKSLLAKNPALLNNPRTVAAIREIASDIDGIETGLLAPIPLRALPGNRSKTSGVQAAAGGIIDAANVFGWFRETPVSVRKTSEFDTGTAPTSLVERSKSFPSANNDPNGEQIRIDRYDVPGKGVRYDVYIGGTASWDPTTTTQPFDLTSDVQGVAGRSAASVRAVERALAKAGVTADTPVVLNGYSQGGLVASMVAASGKYKVEGVVTFGAPSGQVRMPADIPVLTVRNSEDIVPPLGGYDTNDHAVIVQRSVFSHGGPPPGDPVAAHRLSYYQQTAAAVDGVHSSEVRSILDKLNSFGSGAIEVQSTMWLATRTKP